MDCLPTEVLAKIASQLKALLGSDSPSSEPKLAFYSTINKTWQDIIERETFRYINIDSNKVPELTAILGTRATQRISSIQVLSFCALYNHSTHVQPSQLGEQRRLRNESFSKSLKILFDLVAGWESSAGDMSRSYLRLCLSTAFRQNARVGAAPSQPRIGGLFGRQFVTGPLPGVANNSQDAPVVNLDQTDLRYVGQELPDLNIVSSVTLSDGYKIHPESLMRILSRMKCLVKFEGIIFGECRSLDLTYGYRKGM